MTCPYFRTMFTSGFKEGSEAMIELHEIDPEAFAEVLEYLYCGEIALTDLNVLRIAKLADMFELPSLHEFCCQFLTKRICGQNCLGFMKFGRQLNSIKLEKAAFKFALENFSDVTESEEFLEMNRTDLCAFLKQPALSIPHEEHVLRGALKWLDHSRDDRLKHFKDVLCAMHLLDIDLSVQKFVLMKSEVLRKDEGVVQLLREVQDHILYKYPPPAPLEVLCPRLLTISRKGIVFFFKKDVPPRVKNQPDFASTVFLEHESESALRRLKISHLSRKENVMFSAGSSFCAMDSGTIYGTGLGAKFNEIWSFSLNYKQWKIRNQMPRPLSFHRAVSGCDDKIYIIGGVYSDDFKGPISASKEIFEYNCGTDCITRVANLITPVYKFGAVFIRGDILVVGGMQPIVERDFRSEIVSSVQKFDTFTKQCTLLTTTIPYLLSGILHTFMPQSTLFLMTADRIIAVDVDKLLATGTNEEDFKMMAHHDLGKDFCGGILGKRLVFATRTGAVFTVQWQTMFEPNRSVMRFEHNRDLGLGKRCAWFCVGALTVSTMIHPRLTIDG